MKIHPLNMVLLFLCCGLMMSCAPWRDRYFDGGVNELTKENIKEKLGKPHIVKDPLLSDESIWKYRFALTESELDPWGVKTLGIKASGALSGPDGSPRQRVFCYVYVLRFDKENILRQWERVLCEIPKPPDPFKQNLSG